MYNNFNKYMAQRESQEFNQKFNILCEAISFSGILFEDYWSNVAVPTIKKSYSYSNEKELLNELCNNFYEKFDNVLEPLGISESYFKNGINEAQLCVERRPIVKIANRLTSSDIEQDEIYKEFLDKASKWASQGIGNMAKNFQQGYNDSRPQTNTIPPQTNTIPPQTNTIPPQTNTIPPETDKDLARQKKIDDFQQTVNQHIDVMKKRFSTAMRDFLKATTDDATRQNDAHMWQVANTFYKKIMSAAQPVIDEFKLKVKLQDRNSNPYKAEFEKQKNSNAPRVPTKYGGRDSVNKSDAGSSAADRSLMPVNLIGRTS